jgi:hypothetical protein
VKAKVERDRQMAGKRKLDSEIDVPSLLQLAKKATLLGKYGVAAAKAMPVPSSERSDADDESSDAESSSGHESGSDSADNGSSSESSSSSDDSDSEESEDEAEVQRRMNAKAEAKKKAVAAAQAAIDAWMNNADKSPSPQRVKKEKSAETSGSKAFKRVDNEVWSKEIINGLEDNTYENVFGEGGYGAKASAKLLQVQGKKFQHEKTKAKRSSSYKGGAIDASAASKSFKYEDSD